MVMTMDKSDREQWLRHKAMFPIYDEGIESLAALYAGHGSFALVRNGREFGRPGFVALTPRHMETRQWRSLYWLGVKRLVVYGRELGTLCDACFNAIPCLQAGRGTDPRFKCKVTDKLLSIKTSRRDRGEDREEVGS
jgi:hypothetical protein